jgi:lipopolysaccharide/colanic/teichoic acid biosynthesis glycosyltransferase
VRPGITGLAQVAGRNHVEWADRLALDIAYVSARSLSLDARILWQTLHVVLTREGISGAGTATMAPFRGTAAR